MSNLINPDHQWTPGQIFVFGSNLRGIHGGGAARFARLNCGAEMGVGEGLTGTSYAIPTKADPSTTLPLHDIQEAAAAFMNFAIDHPAFEFFVTRIGCGLAGYTDEQIAPFFCYRLTWYWGRPMNILFPPEWDQWIPVKRQRPLPRDQYDLFA